jgi:hypothetical protein
VKNGAINHEKPAEENSVSGTILTCARPDTTYCLSARLKGNTDYTPVAPLKGDGYFCIVQTTEIIITSQ